MSAPLTLRAATRGSILAHWQTDHIAELLGPQVTVDKLIVRTAGDRTQALDTPIEAIGGQGVFSKEVQMAVLSGEADFAVHSAKDLPSQTADGLVIAGIPQRGDPRDAMVGCPLEGLPTGAVVGTGSVRRRAQLAALRPDLTFGNLRGNVDTRLQKAPQFDAIVLAFAPLARIGRTDVQAHVLDPSVMLPQVGQGALAVECRADDHRLIELLAAVEHEPSRRAVDAERAFLAALGGGCDLPVGAYATVTNEGVIDLRALLAGLDGRIVLRGHGRGDDPVELGGRLAQQLLYGDGGAELLLAHRQALSA